MLLFEEYDREMNHRTLEHGTDVFHKALDCVLLGEKRFHVKNPNGEDYDLVYTDNQSWAESSPEYPDSPLFHKDPLYPPYLIYDEKNKDRLCFDIFEGFDRVWFSEVSEYTVVLTGILLAYTDLPVMWKDERISWFYPGEDRIKIADDPGTEDKTVLRVINTFHASAFICDFYTMDPVVLFHHVFVFQWLTKLPMDKVRYAEILVARSEGIGSVLTLYARTMHFLERFGIEVTIQPGSSRYADHIFEKYFSVRMTPSDADETNTIYITNYFGLLFTKMLRYSSGNDFDATSLSPAFLAEMKEYANAVLGDKKMLGILLRGSDYIASGMSGASAPVTVESAIPKIREWMDEGGYDGIFLATEDRDILGKMLEAFPGKIRAVSQERYGIEDFTANNVKTISELDSKRHPEGEDYDAFLEDSTANYFYALYLLSRCESFMYSGQCGGIVMTKSLSEKGFRRMWCFAQNKEIK
jgi:hypothetical protein